MTFLVLSRSCQFSPAPSPGPDAGRLPPVPCRHRRRSRSSPIVLSSTPAAAARAEAPFEKRSDPKGPVIGVVELQPPSVVSRPCTAAAALRGGNMTSGRASSARRSFPFCQFGAGHPRPCPALSTRRALPSSALEFPAGRNRTVPSPDAAPKCRDPLPDPDRCRCTAEGKIHPDVRLSGVLRKQAQGRSAVQPGVGWDGASHVGSGGSGHSGPAYRQ